MKKIVLLIPLLLFANAALAQGNQQACARDVSKYCRAKMNDGDMVVLGCLKENRSKLSKTCSKVLADNGQ